MASFTYDEVMQWSVDDVLEWLRRNNLAEFQDLVSDERIDGPDFIKLDKGRISNCRNVPKPKREALLKRLKEFEKERAKMQKNAKSVQKTPNGRAVPPVPAANAHPPAPSAPTRGALPRPDDDLEDEYYLNDEDEWDDDQDVYDNDEILQPPKGRRSNVLPPPPPIVTPSDDDEDDEDYVQPADPPPNVRPPPPPPVDDDDDDCLYEKANPAKMPGRTPPPRNPPPAPIQRPVPQAPAQGPAMLHPRVGRPPVAPPHQLSAYEEDQPVLPAPPPRNASPPLISRSTGPTGPSGPKTLVPPGVRGRAPLPVPQPDPEELYEPTDEVQTGSPQEIYEHPDDIEPPSLRPGRDPRVLPPRPISEVYEDPQEEKPPSLPPGRDARVLPPRPPSEVYEDPQDQMPVNSDYESVDDVKAKMKQVPSGVSGRAPVPVPVPSDDPDDMYETTDTVSPPQLPHPLPPHTGSSARPGQRAPPPRPVVLPDPSDGAVYEATDEEPQVNHRHEGNPPEKPQKLQVPGAKLISGVPSVGIIGGLDSCAVRDAKSKLRKGIPRDFSPAKVATDKPQEEVRGVGDIKKMFQEQAQNQPPVKASKANHLPVASKANPLPVASKANHLPVASKADHLPPPAARVAMVPPSHSTSENNAPGAPEPPRRPQGRAPPPGPPGSPPETVNSPVVVATPLAAAVDPNDITSQPWYFGNCERDKANQMLLGSTEDGTYLVRDSKGSGQPYTLGIYYKEDVFNISIRKRSDGKFALGKDKPDEHVFETIFDMIRFHRNNAIEVSKNGSFAGKVKLAKVVEK